MTLVAYNTQPWLTAVRLATTANQSGTYYNGSTNNGVGATFTYATGALTIDSVTVAVGDRLLFKDQTSGLENGIYVCTTAGATGVAAVLQRSTDQQSIEQMNTGFYASIAAGTVNGGGIFVMVEPKPGAIGTDSIVWSSVSGTGVVSSLPTIANHFAVYSGTNGDITEDVATAIQGGNIQAGLSGTAGTVASFPATASRGSLKLVGVANTGNTDVTISNAAHGQASVYSMPDTGQATSNFVMTNSTGTQTIATGSLALTAGNVTATAGNLVAGSSGAAGIVSSFSSTAARGSLRLVAVANTGDTLTTISNAAMGQASVVSIPDPAAATANFCIRPTALVSGNVVKASGTAGLIVDAGFAVLANTTAEYGGGGSSNAFVATGLAATSIVTAVILASTNATYIAKAVPTANTLTVTFGADPGAATTVSWIAITPAV